MPLVRNKMAAASILWRRARDPPIFGDPANYPAAVASGAGVAYETDPTRAVHLRGSTNRPTLACGEEDVVRQMQRWPPGPYASPVTSYEVCEPNVSLASSLRNADGTPYAIEQMYTPAAEQVPSGRMSNAHELNRWGHARAAVARAFHASVDVVMSSNGDAGDTVQKYAGHTDSLCAAVYAGWHPAEGSLQPEGSALGRYPLTELLSKPVAHAVVAVSSDANNSITDMQFDCTMFVGAQIRDYTRPHAESNSFDYEQQRGARIWERRWNAPIDLEAAPDAKRRRMMQHLNAKAPAPGVVAGALVRAQLGVHERILGRLGAAAQLAHRWVRDKIDNIAQQIARVEMLWSAFVEIGAPLHVQGYDSYLIPAASPAPIVAGDYMGVEEIPVRIHEWVLHVSATRMHRPLDIVDGHLRVLQLTYLRVHGALEPELGGVVPEPAEGYGTPSEGGQSWATVSITSEHAPTGILQELQRQLDVAREDVARLTKELEQLRGHAQAEADVARHTIAELEEELRATLTEYEQLLQSSAEQASGEATRLRVRIRELEDYLVEARNIANQRFEENIGVMDDLRRSEREIERITVERDHLRRELVYTQKLMAGREVLIVELQQLIAALRDNVKEREQKIAELQRSFGAVKQDLEEQIRRQVLELEGLGGAFTDAHNRAEAAALDFNTAKAQFEHQMALKNAELREATAARDRALKGIEQLKELHEEQENQLLVANGRRGDAERDYKKCEEEIKKKEAELAALRAQLRQKEQELVQQKAAYDAETARLKAAVAEATAEAEKQQMALNAALNQLRAAQAAAKTAAAEGETARLAQKMVEAARTAAQENAAASDLARTEAERRSAEAEERARGAHAAADEAVRARKLAEERGAQARAAATKAAAETQAAQQRADASAAVARSLEGEIAQLKESLAAARASAATVSQTDTARIAQLKKTLGEMQASLETKEAELADAKRQIVQLQEGALAAEREREHLEAQLEEAGRQVAVAAAAQKTAQEKEKAANHARDAAMGERDTALRSAAAAEKAKEDAARRATDAELRAAAAATDAQNASNAKAAAEQRASAAEEAARAAGAKAQAERSRAEALTEESAVLKKQAGVLNKKIAELEKSLAALEKGLATAKQRAESAEIELNRIKLDAESRQKTFDEELRKKQALLAEADGKLKTLHATLEAERRAKGASEESMKDLMLKLTAANLKAVDQEIAVKAARGDLSRNERVLGEFRTANAIMTATIADNAKKMQKLEDTITEVKADQMALEDKTMLKDTYHIALLAAKNLEALQTGFETKWVQIQRSIEDIKKNLTPTDGARLSPLTRLLQAYYTSQITVLDRYAIGLTSVAGKLHKLLREVRVEDRDLINIANQVRRDEEPASLIEAVKAASEKKAVDAKAAQEKAARRREGKGRAP